MSALEREFISEALKPHAKLPKDPKTFDIVNLLLITVIKLVNLKKSNYNKSKDNLALFK